MDQVGKDSQVQRVSYKTDYHFTEGHPDNIPISQATPADQAKLDSLIRSLKERGRALEQDIFTFTSTSRYMKELNPDIDWRNVRFALFFLPPFSTYSDLKVYFIISFC